jgi:antitoxin FitA
MATNIIIRHVPDDVAATLRDRADAAGQSLQAYALNLVLRDARTPTTDEWLAATRARLARGSSGEDLSIEETLRAIADGRR